MIPGGSGWTREDVLELKNIFIPDPKAEIDMSCILGSERKISHVLSSENFFKVTLHCDFLPMQSLIYDLSLSSVECSIALSSCVDSFGLAIRFVDY